MAGINSTSDFWHSYSHLPGVSILLLTTTTIERSVLWLLKAFICSAILGGTGYIEKKYPYDCFVVPVQHSVIMANFIKPETHQSIIVIVLIIYSVYLLKNLVEL